MLNGGKMINYATKELAESALAASQEDYEVFCPVIKNTCRADCVCYASGHVKTINSSLRDTPDCYHVYGPSCTHVLISQTIYVDQ